MNLAEAKEKFYPAYKMRLPWLIVASLMLFVLIEKRQRKSLTI